MADKSFIEFRLDPDNIKEELSQLIPYYETLKYYHENPDAPISETAKVALNETPFIGSLLRGEPVDAAKEAIIMGMPIPQNKFKIYKRNGTVDNDEYKFLKTLANNPNAKLKGNLFIDESQGKYFVKDPNTNKLVDMSNLERVDPNSPYENYYDATIQDINNTLNEYQFVLDNLSPAKLKKARRFSGAGEDVQVGRKTYKPVEFHDTYRTLLEDLETYRKIYNELMNNKTKNPQLISKYGLLLKNAEKQRRMMEQADDFTQFGPYLKDDGTNALNNALNDNSKRFIEEDDIYVDRKDPWWVGTMRDWKKSGRYDP